MSKENTKHTATFNKDPLTDRKGQVNAQKGFKGSEMPKNPFKDGKPKTQIDAFYTPHKGKEVK